MSQLLQIVTFLMVLLSFSWASGQEICNNGIDDDGNGLTDLNDPQCICNQSLMGNPVSLIPNPSFEDTLCCPVSLGEITCAAFWQSGTFGTTDYYNSCFLPAGIANAGLTPFPDGTGCAGMMITQDYKEYAGTCLVSPLTTGIPYMLKIDVSVQEIDPMGSVCPVAPTDYSPFALTIYGAPNCGNLPSGSFGSSPISPFVAIGSVLYDPLASWETVYISFTPTFDVAEIIIGPPSVLPTDYPLENQTPCFPYLLIDHLVLNSEDSFDIPLEIVLSGDLCEDDAQLSASAMLPGGSWQWYKDGIAIVGQTNPVLMLSNLNLGGGNYTVWCTKNGDCISASLTVADAEPLVITVNSDTICGGEQVILIASDNAVTYTWSPATGLNTTNGPVVIASPATTMNYSVTAIAANGCVDSAVATVVIQNVPIAISASPNPATTDNPFVQFEGGPSNGNLSWNFGDNSIGMGASVLHEFPGVDGSYEVQLIAQTAEGCVDTLFLTVLIQSDLTIFVPNTFTPDGNSFNNTFHPVFSGRYQEGSYEFLIFNRWGEVIFKTGDVAESWDGSWQGSWMPVGVYTWKLQINQDDSTLIQLKGHVNLIR